MIETLRTSAPGLRVFLLSPYPRGDKVTGGVEAVAQALAPALALQPEIAAVQVTSFCRGTREFERVMLNARLTVHYVPAQRHFELPTGAILNVLRVRQLAKQFRPDIIHGQEGFL